MEKSGRECTMKAVFLLPIIQLTSLVLCECVCVCVRVGVGADVGFGVWKVCGDRATVVYR